MSDGTFLWVAAERLLPLKIHAVEFQNPTLVLVGNCWSLALLGAWTWHRGDTVLTDWQQAAAEDVVWELCGLELVGVQFPDPKFDGDCSFILSDGSLEARSDRTGYETWTFAHERLDAVYVGL